MTCIFYMNANHTMHILNLYVGKISKTKLQTNYYNKKLNSTINKRRQELKTSTEEQSLILLFIFYFSFFPFSNKNTKDTEATS